MISRFPMGRGSRFWSSASLSCWQTRWQRRGRSSPCHATGGEIRRCLQEKLRKSLYRLNEKIEDISSLVITGNTAMLYLLLGEGPEPLSHAPFPNQRILRAAGRPAGSGYPGAGGDQSLCAAAGLKLCRRRSGERRAFQRHNRAAWSGAPGRRGHQRRDGPLGRKATAVLFHRRGPGL